MISDDKAEFKFIRFQQRFSNLSSASNFLTETLDCSIPDRFKNPLIIKAFELAFELCWKSLKDLLEYEGIVTQSPRDTIKEAFRTGHVGDGQAWLEMLDKRNRWTHVYNENQATVAAREIKILAAPHISILRETLAKVASR